MTEPRKPAIPGPDEPGFDSSVKEIVEIITGRRGNVGKIAKLPTTATLADVISKVNAILDRLQM